MCRTKQPVFLTKVVVLPSLRNDEGHQQVVSSLLFVLTDCLEYKVKALVNEYSSIPRQ